MVDTFLNMAADFLVPVLSGTHSTTEWQGILAHTLGWNLKSCYGKKKKKKKSIFVEIAKFTTLSVQAASLFLSSIDRQDSTRNAS